MRCRDADALEELFREVIGGIAKKPEMNCNLEHMVRASAMVIEMIQDAPTIEPQRKMGKWNFIGDQMFECSECGTYYTQSQFHQMRVRISDTEFPKFCPNCGAEMLTEGEG